MEPPKEDEMTFAQKMKYYTTLTMGLTACLSSFIFMFLIPWVLNPSIKTLWKNFDPEPVVCKTVLSEHQYGSTNCSWSTCKEGCTKEIFECDQIYVNYMHVAYEEWDGQEFDDDDEIWVGRGLPIFVNIKACGYPPDVNCSIVADAYGPEGSVFPCFYSR